MSYPQENITAIILAGGLGRRMNMQDKGLVKLDDRQLFHHLIERLSPQVGQVLINANRNIDEYARSGHPVVSDELADFQGPLSGIVSALQIVTTPLVMIVPCDSPFVPDDLVAKLYAAMHDDLDIVIVNDGQRLQPLFMLARADIASSINTFLQQGQRKVMSWLEGQRFTSVDFSTQRDAFFNINTSEELSRAKGK